MNRFKNCLIVGAVFALLVTIGLIMNSHQVAAQGPPNGLAVNIVNPLPVPVTGSTNPATAPVLALNVNDPGRIPYQSKVQDDCLIGSCDLIFPVVPANHRLVIQNVSGRALFPSTPQNLFVSLFEGPEFVATASGTFGFGATTAFNQPLLYYIDGGKRPDVLISGPLSGAPTRADATLTGYMLDCTLASCASIAK